jgi:hypothetical protein
MDNHFKFSMVKSGIRIFGYTILIVSGQFWLVTAGIILILSELIGIGEEIV